MSEPTTAPRAPALHALPARNDGWKMLLKKEILRFWRVAFQTIAAPVLSAVLFLVIFSHVLSDRVQVYPGVSYVAFLVPGLVMMAVLQNAFANSASSMVQSKIMGNLVFTLLTPLSPVHTTNPLATATDHSPSRQQSQQTRQWPACAFGSR